THMSKHSVNKHNSRIWISSNKVLLERNVLQMRTLKLSTCSGVQLRNSVPTNACSYVKNLS
ncbi:hypothetical protein L9F63_007894, partial [Diploptera punctata]